VAFGLVMIEALACGTPVIAWRNGSVPEVIADGVTGFIVDTMDEAVRAVADVPGLDRRICRQVFEEHFDAVRMARDYVDVYRRLIQRGSEQRDVRHEARSGDRLRGDMLLPSRPR
jgi:glycosyltransferase involved in cell wall biosynthesis